ncbi:MAG: MFS transporter, partial [Bacteroidota bacterium]
PNGTIWLLSITPLKKRALVMGLFTSALFLGQFFSPIIVQPVDTAVGLPNTFLITGGFAAVSAIIYGLLGKYDALKTSSKKASV